MADNNHVSPFGDPSWTIPGTESPTISNEAAIQSAELVLSSAQEPATTETSEQLASASLKPPARNEYLGLPYELILQLGRDQGIREKTSWERLSLLTSESRKAILEERMASYGFKETFSDPFITVLEETLFYSTPQSLKKLEEISLIEEYSSKITTLSFCGLQFASEGDVPECEIDRNPEECAEQEKEWAECRQRGSAQEEFRSSGEYVKALSQIFTRFPKLRHIQYWPVHPERSGGYWVDDYNPYDESSGPNRRFRWERTDAHLYKNTVDFGFWEQAYKEGDDLQELFAALFNAKVCLKTFTTPHLANTARWVGIGDMNLRSIDRDHCAAVFSELEELRINVHNEDPDTLFHPDVAGIRQVLRAAPNLRFLDLTFTGRTQEHKINFTGLGVLPMPKLEELRLSFDHATALVEVDFLRIFAPDTSTLLGLRRLCLGYMTVDQGTWENVLTALGTRLNLESLWLISPRFDEVVLIPPHFWRYYKSSFKHFDAIASPAFNAAARKVRVLNDWEPFETVNLVARGVPRRFRSFAVFED
ncbi:hypothetical protein BU16DRAFT_562212 [Lophium mytilinum]|uniref:Uncharacterized protein n=1 Tax=Lophium mytilinum TaxID=390894 RepID=A0A6A6QQW8_9PEZI|nr:hypothetical protein BU16DRAFT_562212 [Lophium mytilinum]